MELLWTIDRFRHDGRHFPLKELNSPLSGMQHSTLVFAVIYQLSSWWRPCSIMPAQFCSSTHLLLFTRSTPPHTYVAAHSRAGEGGRGSRSSSHVFGLPLGTTDRLNVPSGRTSIFSPYTSSSWWSHRTGWGKLRTVVWNDFIMWPTFTSSLWLSAWHSFQNGELGSHAQQCLTWPASWELFQSHAFLEQICWIDNLYKMTPTW